MVRPSYYIGLTSMRIAAAFVAPWVTSKQFLIYGSYALILGSALILVAPGSTSSIVGLVIFGIRCAPVFPAIISQTPHRFGRENTKRLMGIQMGCAYLGSLSVPPRTGC